MVSLVDLEDPSVIYSGRIFWDMLRPGVRLAVMGPKGAVEIIFRSDIGDEEKIAERTEEYRRKFANPFIAGSRGYIDDVIAPHATRKRLCRSLSMLREKKIENPWRKHDNIPL